MRQRWLSLALIVVLVLAACDQNEAPPDVAWCYTYDFTEVVPANVTIVTGYHLGGGLGIVTDETGELYISISESLYIEVEYVTVYGERGAPDDISLSAGGSAFGLPVFVDGVLPFNVDTFTHTEVREPDVFIEAGNSAYLEMQTGGPIVINQIEVGGYGASPFPVNPCSDSPTPVPATSTATATETSTPGPTFTPTVTDTPDPGAPWICEFDFTINNGGWLSSKGTYSSGVGWVHADGTNVLAPGNNWAREVAIFRNPDIAVTPTITEFTMHYTRVAGSSSLGGYMQLVAGDNYVSDVLNATTGNGSGTHSFGWTGSETRSSIRMLARAGAWNAQTYSGSVTITGATVAGVGILPFYSSYCSNLTPTPTPTLTITYTATHTATAPHTATRTPIGGPGAGTPTMTRTPSRTPIIVGTWTPVNTSTALPSSTPIPSLPPPTLIPTVITVTPQTYTPENSSTPNPVTGTPFGTPGGTPWGTPVAWGTPWGTPDGTAIVAGTGLPDMRLTPEYGPVYGFLSTAAAEVNSIPGQITGYIPQVDPGPLFGYVKWAASCVSAQELVGQTLSPILCHTIIGVGLNLVLAGIFMSVRIVRLFIKVVNWIMKQILRVIPFMGG